jgi:hypothetical protein
MRHLAPTILCIALGTVPLPGSQAAKSASRSGATAHRGMSNADVVQLVKAGLSQEVIITAIRQASSRDFDLTPAGLVALKGGKVPDSVILVMQNPGKREVPGKAASVAGLSRQKAAELISKQQNLPSTQIIALSRHIMKSWDDPDRSGSIMPAITLCVVNQSGETYADLQPRFQQWTEKGLLHVVQEDEHSGNCNYRWGSVRLTTEGFKYLVNPEMFPENPGLFTKGTFLFKLRTYDLVFGEITGIQVNEQFKVAEVEYTVRRVNVTPFAGEVSLEPMRRTARFALYDDGWRIK